MTAVFIVVVVMAFAALIAKMGMDYTARLRGPAAPDRSITTSELEAIIHNAVDASTADLEQRLVSLEERMRDLERPALPRRGEAGPDRGAQGTEP